MMQYGRFDTDHDEYVIERVDLPASWINYIGVENWCAVLNQNAGGYAFYRSSERGRVTRFRPNGVPRDRPGHYLYLRDDADGDYWSASWQPVGKPLEEADYRTRHGLSYSVFESEYRGISASQRIFVPLGEDVEIWDVTVTNTSGRRRTLSLFGYVEFSFHSVQIDNENFQMSLYASGADYADGVIEDDFYYEPWTYHFFTATRTPDGFDTRREAFIGEWRSETNPVAVERGECTGSQGTTGNHVGALHHRLTLAPGETVRFAYLLGYGRRAVGQRLREKYADPAAVDAALDDLAAYWRVKQSVFACHTPSEAMNTLIGTWTLYQAETCAVWSRFASFVEVGGRSGLGYRDTAQDIGAVVATNPGVARRRIIELLRGQMSPGYGLHLFEPSAFGDAHPEIPVGVKLPTVVPSKAGDRLHGLADACSDDHLWLVGSVVAYIAETGEVGLLDEIVPFADSDVESAVRDAVLGAAYAARYDPAPATVLDHLLRALEFSAAQVGDNGVAKGLRADWNDCLNLGGGQTALVSFLHVWAARELRDLLAGLSAELKDRLLRLDEMIATTTAAANRELWDGAWYIRGYTRDGVKIGSASCDEGRIFLEHMPWAVIAGVADDERGRSSLDAVHELLAGPYGVHLCWPAYTRVDDTIGYVTRVYPGVKENAAIFSHPNAWPIIAETMLGRGDRAMALYQAMAPYNQNDAAERRVAEPYVYAQFLYGRDHPWYGRAENPWLTGTAGWMYIAATRYILGVRPTLTGLTVDPCIPASWDGFHLTRRWRGATYEIEVTNPDHVAAGVASVKYDGEPLPVVMERARPTAVLPVARPGTTHRVRVRLG